jgi:hypothetical protein
MILDVVGVVTFVGCCWWWYSGGGVFVFSYIFLLGAPAVLLFNFS